MHTEDMEATQANALIVDMVCVVEIEHGPSFFSRRGRFRLYNSVPPYHGHVACADAVNITLAC